MKSKDLDDTLGQCRKRRQADHRGKQQSQEFCKLAPVGMDPSQQPTAIKSLIMQMVGLNQATQSSNSIKQLNQELQTEKPVHLDVGGRAMEIIQ
jgi:hypothetical protein